MPARRCQAHWILELIPKIGRNLKDPAIIEILDRFDVSVVYDFDRDFENQPDKYWAHLYSEGLLFRFDESQRLDTVFVYLQPTDQFQANPGTLLDFERFENIAHARTYARQNGLPYTQNRDKPGVPTWIRIEHPTCYVHYQFGDNVLSLVTIMAPGSAP